MSPRPGRTPLYELMRQPRRPRAEIEPELEIAPRGDDRGAGWPAWLMPGHAIRLPVGYVLVASAVVVLAIVLAYVVGHEQAERRVTAAYEALLLEQSRQRSAALGLQDPLDETTTGLGVETVTGDVPPLALPEPSRGPEPMPSRGGPIVVTEGGDPRQPGLHYFVIAETREDGAIRLAEFCRDQGLDAYVVPGHNSRLRRVIVLPGFGTRLRTDPEVARLADRIFEAGARWKSNKRGASNFRDAYMARYNG